MWPFSTIKRLREQLRQTEQRLEDVTVENGMRHQKLWQNEVEIDSLKIRLAEAKTRLNEVGIVSVNSPIEEVKKSLLHFGYKL